MEEHVLHSKVQKIRDLCTEIGLANHHIDNVENMVRASIPSRAQAPHLPTNLLTGFSPIDYLIAPVKNNTRMQIYGRAGSAKTSIIAHLVSSIVEHYHAHALWLDSTFKLNAKFFKKFKLGDNLRFIQTSSITNEIIDIVLGGMFRVIVIDDVGAFKNECIAKLERILYYCRMYKILVLLANQVRVIPKTGRVYTPKQELLTSYDLTLRAMKYRLHYDQKYNDYDVKLEYHQGTGKMDGQSVIIPITTAGHIKKDLMETRLARMAKAANYNNFYEYINDRVDKFDQ